MNRVSTSATVLPFAVFGAHLSIAGGLHAALLRGEKLGCDTIQLFTANPRSWSRSRGVTQYVKPQNHTKNQQQWKCSPLTTQAIEDWKSHAKRLKFRRTVSHDSYLINLAGTNSEFWRKSVELFIEELTRCQQLGIPYLVTHPGAHMGEGDDAGIAKVVAALDVIHDNVPDTPRGGGGSVVTCLEVTAGQGSCLGCKLEHLAEIIQRVRAPHRLGVCLDTAHLFAAGYDFRGPRKYAAFRKELAATVGIKAVKVIHMNDSKKDLGSRVDRHAHIGHGFIGLDGFKSFARDAAWKNVPKILETPKEGQAPDGREWDAVNLETLRSLVE